MTEKTKTLAEKFSESSTELIITSGDKTYVLARFSDFKDTYKLALLKHLFTEYDALDSDKQFYTFIHHSNPKSIRTFLDSNKIGDLNESEFGKIPLFIIKQSDIKNYLTKSNNPPIINQNGELNFNDKYTYYYTINKMMVMTDNPNPPNMMVEVKKNNTEINKFNKLSEIEIPMENDKKLTYYTLSESGEEFKWNL